MKDVEKCGSQQLRDVTKAVCVTCRQPIRSGESSVSYATATDPNAVRHIHPSDCVAAAVRRCAEIARKQQFEYLQEWNLRDKTYSFCYDRSVASGDIANAINAEFKEPK